MFVRTQTNGSRTYLLIVDNEWVGGDTVRFGPGSAGHLLTQLRGAEAKLPGQSVYLTLIFYSLRRKVAATY